MEIFSTPSSGSLLQQPRTLVLLALLAAAGGFAAVRVGDSGAPVSEELQALGRQGLPEETPPQNPAPVGELSTAEDYIRASRLIAYDVAAAARVLEQDPRGDLFDCYVSMFLPPRPQPGDLESIRKALGLLDAVPERGRDYRYHIKMAYCEFYRFVLIPVLHQREKGEHDLEAPELEEAGESFDAALYHAGQSGDALSGVYAQLQAMAGAVRARAGKYDAARLKDYFHQKQPLIRQIL